MKDAFSLNNSPSRIRHRNDFVVNTTPEKIETLVHSLAERGWTAEDFRKNHLEYVSRRYLDDSGYPLSVPFDSYWRTVGRISSILQNEGIFHVIIKTRRNYVYADTNVDVFVKGPDSALVQRILCNDHWRMPSSAVILKQRLIEREKVKLPPRISGLVPAHLYMSVSWRYQREVTFLDEAMIDQVPLSEEAPELDGEFGSLLIPMPSRAADIVLHCAEIVFENYRLSLGEAIYLSWLMQHVSELEKRRAFRLGLKRGAGAALRCVIANSREGAANDPDGVGTDWPRNFTARELFESWGERFRVQAGRGRLLSACEEWLGYAAFAGMYRVKRTWFE